MEGLTWNSTLIRGQKQEKKSVNEECRAGLVVRDLKEEAPTGWKGRGGGAGAPMFESENRIQVEDKLGGIVST